MLHILDPKHLFKRTKLKLKFIDTSGLYWGAVNEEVLNFTTIRETKLAYTFEPSLKIY